MRDLNEEPMYVEDRFDLAEQKRKFAGLRRFNAKLRQNKRLMRALSVFAAVLFVLALVCLGHLLSYRMELKRAENINETVRGITSGEAVAPVTAPAAAPVAKAQENAPVRLEPVSQVIEQPPETLEKIVKLRETFSNEDIIGHLKIDGTEIDYAVAQYTDNEYYLERDLYGEPNAAGSIYMDYECDPVELSRNTVIYGHNMRNGSMFHNLRYYSDKAYWQEHPYIYLTTPYEETKWEIFSFYKTGTDFYYIQVLFPSDKEFLSLLTQMKIRSVYDTGVGISVDDKILTLSTCSNTPDDARLVLNAKLVAQ